MKTNKSVVISPKKTAKNALSELHNEKVKTPEEVAKETSLALQKFGVSAKEKVTIVDPITKEVREVSLSRTGTQESDLIVALADPNLGRDQKDHALSMYLWGRGAESASLIVDLMRYKGAHTKETRVFKSQMRFDFEAFIKMTAEHLREQAERVAKIMGVNLSEEIEAYKEWLSKPNNKGKEYTYWDFLKATANPHGITDPVKAAMISEAIFGFAHAERLDQSRDNIAKAREREKGGGIYIDSKGRAYSIQDPQMEDVVKADREASAEIENE